MILSDIVGKKYKLGSYGPNEFDCWGLVVYVYKEILNIDLPKYLEFAVKDKYPAKMQSEIFKLNSSWEIIDKPEAFCCVAMSRTRQINHVGIWLDIEGGICMHAQDEKTGVIAQSIAKLKASGFNNLLFLRYKN